MLESQRREMMEAMGVKILSPRFQLPAAKISPTLIEKVLNEKVLVDQALADPESLKAHSGEVPLDKIKSDINESLASPEEALVTDQKSIPANIASELSALIDIKSTLQAADKTKEKAIKFRYRLVRVGELLMVLSQPSIEWQESTEAKQFFSDIYFALTDKKPEFLSESQFEWPPTKQFPFAHDKEMAIQTLHSFMQEQMQQPACKWILVWGSQLVEHLFETLPKVGEIEFINESPVLLLDSLHHYWDSPDSKKLLWQSLQTVKKSLISQ